MKTLTVLAMLAPVVWSLFAGYLIGNGKTDYRLIALAALSGAVFIPPAVFAIKARLRVIYPLTTLSFHLGGLLVHVETMQATDSSKVSREMHRAMLDAFSQLELLEPAENSVFFSLTAEESARLSEARAVLSSIFQTWKDQQ